MNKEIQKSNSISPNFPLYHSDLVPIYQGGNKTVEVHKKLKLSGIYSNEHPDFFRLYGMKEGGSYKNKYLDEVIKVDRSEQFKKLDFNRKQINLIDCIKSNRTLSQDPNVLKYIRSDYEIQMEVKRNRLLNENNVENHEDEKYTLTEGRNKNDYDKLIKKLGDVSPKISYKYSAYIDRDNAVDLNGKYKVSNYNDLKKFKTIKCDFNPRKSSYLGNCNDYKICEADKLDKNKEIYINFKPKVRYDPLQDNYIVTDVPPKRFDRWTSFYQNFFMVNDEKLGKFKKKGGLFSEFTDKNIGSINVNLNQIRERIKKQKEIEKQKQ